jgi:hypothetical protein
MVVVDHEVIYVASPIVLSRGLLLAQGAQEILALGHAVILVQRQAVPTELLKEARLGSPVIGMRLFRTILLASCQPVPIRASTNAAFLGEQEARLAGRHLLPWLAEAGCVKL